jgi:MFS family permease
MLPMKKTPVTAVPEVLSPTSFVRLRIAITLFFVVHGFIFAGWVVRIPAIKRQTGASAATLGLALLGLSVGAVATMLVTGALCRRFGSRQVTVVTCALLSLTVALPPLAHSALTLALALLVFGAAYGGLNVAMNSVAVDLVTAIRRPIMSSFHAAWSFGALAGAGLGALIAPHLSPARHLLLLLPIGLLVTAVGGYMLLLHPIPHTKASDAARERTQRAWHVASRLGLTVVVFGLIALCDTYGEGALGDWGPLHITQDLGGSQSMAAAGFGAFALAEAIGRLFGTVLLERLGQTRVLVAGGLIAGVGMLLGALAPSVWLVLVGFALAGLGLANIFPTVLARAGALGGPPAVAIAVTLGYGGFLLGPPTIGFLASSLGLPIALTTLAFLALAASVIAYAAREAGSRTGG